MSKTMQIDDVNKALNELDCVPMLRSGIEALDIYINQLRGEKAALAEKLQEIEIENARLHKLGDEFIWGENNPAMYKSEMTKLQDENAALRQSLWSCPDCAFTFDARP